MDTVDVDDPVYLVDKGRKRPAPQKLRSAPSERPPASRHVAEALARQEPIEERPQMLCLVVDGVGFRDIACLAFPSLPACFGLSVPDHGGLADGAFRNAHFQLLTKQQTKISVFIVSSGETLSFITTFCPLPLIGRRK